LGFFNSSLPSLALSFLIMLRAGLRTLRRKRRIARKICSPFFCVCLFVLLTRSQFCREQHLAKHFERLATCLISAALNAELSYQGSNYIVSFSPFFLKLDDLAVLIARAIDVRLLRERALVGLTSKVSDIDENKTGHFFSFYSSQNDDLIDPIEDAVTFTLSAEQDPMLHVSHMPWLSPSTRSFTDSLLTHRFTQVLRARIDELERQVGKGDAV
jgi:hypothetical protein